MNALGNSVADPLYQQLADTLEEMIQHRSLRPGDRMPSLRQFSRQRRVSVPTALQAYAMLEDRGLLEARPKSGFYVRASRADAVRPPSSGSPLPRVTDYSKLDPLQAILASQNAPDLIPLGVALPDPKILPQARMARELSAAARRHSVQCSTYDVPPGCAALRGELARRSLDWGCALNPEDFILTNGCTEALSLALHAVCQPGDTVAVESPTYFGLAALLQELGLKALPIPVDAERGVNLDVLEQALRKTRVAACAFIASFHNPVGSCMSDEDKRRLCTLLARHSIPLIEDDIYGDLQHTGPRPRCLRAFDDNVILCSSFSKTLAPGLRLGYIAPGARWKDRVMRLKQTTTLANVGLPSFALAAYLREGGYERYLRKVRGIYRQQVNHMRELLAHALPEGIALSRPRGGFVLWCELPPQLDAVQLSRSAQRVGISIAPGPLFSPRGEFANFMRINCGYRIDAKIEGAVMTLGKLAKDLLRRKG
ncbi:MAG: PLP-dependent aminotransferase family protein [Chthoniobacter sp.]|uniref:aminotransferase-like domain-containing protein n=1 Tax=Chthoniobacter sp. TaxID=2510640 RepID=UPI0032A63F31